MSHLCPRLWGRLAAGNLRADWGRPPGPARAAVANRRAGCHPAPQSAGRKFYQVARSHRL